MTVYKIMFISSPTPKAVFGKILVEFKKQIINLTQERSFILEFLPSSPALLPQEKGAFLIIMNPLTL